MDDLSRAQALLNEHCSSLPTGVAVELASTLQGVPDSGAAEPTRGYEKPVFTDRHGFCLFPGNVVEKIEDDSRFVVSDVTLIDTTCPGMPVVFLLNDGTGGVVDASLVMLTDEDKDKNSWQRASFCEVCFNHYNCGVIWFKEKIDHPDRRSSVYSACEGCLAKLDR